MKVENIRKKYFIFLFHIKNNNNLFLFSFK